MDILFEQVLLKAKALLPMRAQKDTRTIAKLVCKELVRKEGSQEYAYIEAIHDPQNVEKLILAIAPKDKEKADKESIREICECLALVVDPPFLHDELNRYDQVRRKFERLRDECEQMGE